MKLVCSKCNYRFERESVPNVCPYCGEKGSIVREKTAQEILDEVVAEGERYE